ADQTERQSGSEPGAATARILAQANAAAPSHRSGRGALRSHGVAASSHRRQCDARCSTGPRPVAGEGRRRPIRAGLRNLAVNARDAMPLGGKLTLRTSNVGAEESARLQGKGMPLGEYVLVEVEDTGSGIAPEVIDKIFDPFYTTKDIGKGTGLGLSTVY